MAELTESTSLATLSGSSVLPRSQSLGKRLRKLVQKDVRLVFCLVVIGVVIGAGVFASVLPIDNPSEMSLTNQLAKPSVDHWLGTDSYGRDILSRIIYGARVSLLVGLVTVAIAIALGATSGILAGFYGGYTDSAIMRLMDALLAFPSILLAITLVGVLGSGEFNVMLGLGIVYAPAFARVARAKTLSIVHAEYILAARSIGASDMRLLARHTVPNATGPIIVQATVAFAFAIIAEAGLSFLGLGVPPDVPSWGAMLTEARKYIQTDPWFAFIPGIFLSITVLSITLLGDSLRELLDPTSTP